MAIREEEDPGVARRCVFRSFERVFDKVGRDSYISSSNESSKSKKGLHALVLLTSPMGPCQNAFRRVCKPNNSPGVLNDPNAITTLLEAHMTPCEINTDQRGPMAEARPSPR